MGLDSSGKLPIAFCGTPWKYIFRLESTFMLIYEPVVKHFMVILNDSTWVPVFLAIISKVNSKDSAYSTPFFFDVIPVQFQFVLPRSKTPKSIHRLMKKKSPNKQIWKQCKNACPEWKEWSSIDDTSMAEGIFHYLCCVCMAMVR